MIFRNHYNMLIYCSRNMSDYYQCWKQLCCFIFLWKLWYIFFFRVLWWTERSNRTAFIWMTILTNVMHPCWIKVSIKPHVWGVVTPVLTSDLHRSPVSLFLAAVTSFTVFCRSSFLVLASQRSSSSFLIWVSVDAWWYTWSHNMTLAVISGSAGHPWFTCSRPETRSNTSYNDSRRSSKNNCVRTKSAPKQNQNRFEEM